MILGWALFWVGLIARPCCASPLDSHHPGDGRANMAAVSHSHAAGGESMPCCDDVPDCADPGDVIPTLAQAPASADPSKLKPLPVALLVATADVAFNREPVRAYQIHPSPPLFAPFHRRSSRLLI